MTRLRAVLLAVALLCPATMAQADVVLKWNEIAVKTMIQQGQSPFGQARVAAIVQLAVFEAVNAITGEYEPYIGIYRTGGGIGRCRRSHSGVPGYSRLFSRGARHRSGLYGLAGSDTERTGEDERDRRRQGGGCTP